MRARILKGLAVDAAGVLGVGLVSFGAWLAWAPAGFVVAGTALVLVAIILARRAA